MSSSSSRFSFRNHTGGTPDSLIGIPSTVNSKATFVPKKISKPAAGPPKWTSVYSTCLTPGEQSDPFQCKCHACQHFWKRAFGDENARLLSGAPATRTPLTGPMFHVKDLEVKVPMFHAKDLEVKVPMFHAKDLEVKVPMFHVKDLGVKVGDRVLVWRTHQGVVKYVGPLSDDIASPHQFVGVHLDDDINSSCSGVYKGKRYFYCPVGHGVFVNFEDVIVLSERLEKGAKLTSQSMFPNYTKLKLERQLRQEMDDDYDKGVTFRDQQAQTAESLPSSRVTCRKSPHEYVYDRVDTAYKANVRHVTMTPPKPRPEIDFRANERRRLELKKQFGGGARADKMVAMVEKLDKAYSEGLQIHEQQKSYEH